MVTDYSLRYAVHQVQMYKRLRRGWAPKMELKMTIFWGCSSDINRCLPIDLILYAQVITGVLQGGENNVGTSSFFFAVLQRSKTRVPP